jgi:hypothetical protein
MELEHERAGIHVALIQPAVINTPYYNHARTRMKVEPRAMFPVYEPLLVAEAILHAANHPVRDIVVGDGGKVLTVLQRISPSLVDRLMLANGAAFKLQQRDEPPRPDDNLFTPMNEAGATTGEYTHRSTTSAPSRATSNPTRTASACLSPPSPRSAHSRSYSGDVVLSMMLREERGRGLEKRRPRESCSRRNDARAALRSSPLTRGAG